jgi:hypothetical protein
MPDDIPPPLRDLPDEISEYSDLLEQLPSHQLEEGVDALEDLISSIGNVSRIGTDGESFADIVPEDLPDQAKELSRYAERLIEHRERVERIAENSDTIEVEDVPDDLPEGVPGRATLTTKTINGNDYYYWQWRAGDSIKSEYIGPVNPSH